jgi:hypothetical protein
MYSCIMDDQGFEELADLAALVEDDASFKDLVPALGHRTKIRRLLAAGSQPASTPQSKLDTPISMLPVPSATTEVTAVRRTPLVSWLDEHQLEVYALPLQRAGYDQIADVVELLKSPELLEHLVPIVGHRDRIRRLLGPQGKAAGSSGSFAEQWLGGVKLPAQNPDPELASSQGGAANEVSPAAFTGETDAVNKLLSAVSANFVTRGSSVSPPSTHTPQQGGFEEPDSSSASSSHERRPPAKRTGVSQSTEGVTVTDCPNFTFDAALFVDNPGLDSAIRSGRSALLCKRSSCEPHRCRDLHFREIQVKHEHMKRPCSAAYVSQVTLGYLTAVRKNDRAVACMEENCNSTSCPNVHIGFPLRREVSHNCGTILELGNFSVPLRDCSLTDAFVRLMERPVTLHERRTLQNVRVCPSFTLSQTCTKGVRCWNYHILPPNFSRFFWKSFPLDRLNRHLHSLNHLHAEQYDVAQRMERTGRRSFEVGEALDIMVHTTCRPCAMIFFEVFRSSSRRQGSDLFWALMHRLHSHQGRDDPLMNELTVNTNNVLQLRHSEALSGATPLETMVSRMAEAIGVNLKRVAERVGLGEAGRMRNAYVYWDFDNILFADRNDLTLFYSCLMTYLAREGYASNRSAIHVKAFGTQHSFATDTVDALRDMQVEMVLCSSKKQEETDRQMERSMRALEGRHDSTVVILSSDKDFGSIAKDLTRTGVHVVVVHCAEEASNHDSVLRMSSSESKHIFEVYASVLKTSKPQPKNLSHVHDHRDPVPMPQAPETRTVVSASPLPPDPAIVASHTGAGDAHHQPAQRSILSFFKEPEVPASRPTSVVELEQEILKSTTRAPAASMIPQPRSAHHKAPQSSGGVNIASMLTSKASTDTVTGLRIVPLTSLVQNPQPPVDHRSWYALFVDAYLVRLQDRERSGELRGPFSTTASEESVRREMRVYMEMANMVKGFLPQWFRPDAALRIMYHKVMDDSPDDWMNNDHFLKTYHAEQFVEIFAVLRYIATVVEGPLVGHEECCDAPGVKLRLKST